MTRTTPSALDVPPGPATWSTRSLNFTADRVASGSLTTTPVMSMIPAPWNCVSFVPAGWSSSILRMPARRKITARTDQGGTRRRHSSKVVRTVAAANRPSEVEGASPHSPNVRPASQAVDHQISLKATAQPPAG